MTVLTTELWVLFGTVVITLVSILAQSLYVDIVAGVKYTLSSRDTVPDNFGPLKGRLDRTVSNHVEAMVMFAPLVLLAASAGISNGWTQNAALVFLVSRALYVPAYAMGLVPWRTIIWSVGFGALCSFGWGILSATYFA